MNRAETPLLTWSVEQVARPAMVVCLCCRGWVGVQAQGFFFQVWPALAHASGNRIGFIPRGLLPFRDFFPCLWSSFPRPHGSQGRARHYSQAVPLERVWPNPAKPCQTPPNPAKPPPNLAKPRQTSPNPCQTSPNPAKPCQTPAKPCQTLSNAIKRVWRSVVEVWQG